MCTDVSPELSTAVMQHDHCHLMVHRWLLGYQKAADGASVKMWSEEVLRWQMEHDSPLPSLPVTTIPLPNTCPEALGTGSQRSRGTSGRERILGYRLGPLCHPASRDDFRAQAAPGFPCVLTCSVNRSPWRTASRVGALLCPQPQE